MRFTVADIAHLTGRSVRTLRRHIADGRLPVVRSKDNVFVTLAGARVWLGHDLNVCNAARPSPAADFVSIRVYAAIARLTDREVRHLIDKGAVKTRRIGGRVFVAAEELDALPRFE